MSKPAVQPSPTDDVVPGGINGKETFWVKHYTWLESRGYRLRRRYAPDWIPSWLGTNEHYQVCEDSKSISVCATFFHVKLYIASLSCLARQHASAMLFVW